MCSWDYTKVGIFVGILKVSTLVDSGSQSLELLLLEKLNLRQISRLEYLILVDLIVPRSSKLFLRVFLWSGFSPQFLQCHIESSIKNNLLTISLLLCQFNA